MELSRRNFLVGAGVAAAGVAAVAGLAGCSSEESSSGSSESGGDSSSGSSDDWLGEPPDVTVDDCVDTIETDVLVVGSAMAGMHAAYSALNEGADVIMIERNGAPHISGAQVGYMNGKYLIENGQTEYDPQVVARMFINETQQRCDADLVALYAYNIGDICDDTFDNVLIPAGFEEWSRVLTMGGDDPLDYHQYLNMGVNMCADSSDDSLEKMVTAFHDWISDHGGTITFNTCARKLVQDDDGAVTGVIATNEDDEYVYYKTNKGVIMCTGPYQENEEMLNRFCYPGMAHFINNYNEYNARASDTAPITSSEKLADGLGQRMMVWAGGMMEEIDPAYQCSSEGDQYFQGRTLEVDSDGRRFHNDGISGMSEGYWAFDLPDGSNRIWQIACKTDFEWPGYGFRPQDPEEVWEKALALPEYYQADTIEELAEQIEVDPETLKKEVDRYNEICAQGYDDDFCKIDLYLDPAGIQDPPYYAFPKYYLCECIITGVRVNRYLQVIDADRKPIPGLYAAGNCIGGRQGSGYTQIFPGITNALALSHGYCAGKFCANGTSE